MIDLKTIPSSNQHSISLALEQGLNTSHLIALLTLSDPISYFLTLTLDLKLLSAKQIQRMSDHPGKPADYTRQRPLAATTKLLATVYQNTWYETKGVVYGRPPHSSFSNSVTVRNIDLTRALSGIKNSLSTHRGTIYWTMVGDYKACVHAVVQEKFVLVKVFDHLTQDMLRIRRGSSIQEMVICGEKGLFYKWRLSKEGNVGKISVSCYKLLLS